MADGQLKMEPVNDIDKRLYQLEGILAGIAADGIIVAEEISYLNYWLTLQDDMEKIFPFNLMISKVRMILEDGLVTEAEAEMLKRIIESWLAIKTDPWEDSETGFKTLFKIIHNLKPESQLEKEQLQEISAWAKTAIFTSFALYSQSLYLLAEILKDEYLSAVERQQILSVCQI